MLKPGSQYVITGHYRDIWPLSRYLAPIAIFGRYRDTFWYYYARDTGQMFIKCAIVVSSQKWTNAQ